jgi:hypothetical protein
MLIAFWRIKDLVYVNWLPKNVRIDAVHFRDEILIPISQPFQASASGGHKPWTLVHMDNTKAHTAKRISSVMTDLRVKRAPNRQHEKPIFQMGSSFLTMI